MSIRWRLQLWHGLLLAAVLLALAGMAWRWQWRESMQRVDAELEHHVSVMLGLHHIGNGPPPPRDDNPFLPPPLFGGPPRPDLPDEDDLFSWVKANPTAFYIVWDGEQPSEIQGGKLTPPPTRPAIERGTPMTMQTDNVEVNHQRFRRMYHLAPRRTLAMAGRSVEAEHRASAVFGGQLLAVVTGVWLVAFLGGGWLTKRALRPIQDISATATRMAAGHLSERVNLEETESELGQLGAVLNESFARLQHSFDQQARFTADAAHELRTPLSVVLSQVQLALARERSPQEYRHALETCERAARRMQSLTEALLRLSRLDAEPLALAPIDLAGVMREAADMLSSLASEKGVQLDLHCQPTPCRGDAESLHQVLSNLITNALTHCPSGKVITLTTSLRDGHAVAEVRDEGPGIAAEHLPNLFDRFYRADASRNRSSGGAGLGLAICKAIVDAHGGEISVSTELGKGSVFRVSLVGASE